LLQYAAAGHRSSVLCVRGILSRACRGASGSGLAQRARRSLARLVVDVPGFASGHLARPSVRRPAVADRPTWVANWLAGRSAQA
jgi:hypothetical protein